MVRIPCIQLAERRLPVLLAFMTVCVVVSYAAYPTGKARLNEKLLMENYPSETLSENFDESETLGDAGAAAYFWKPIHMSPFWKRSSFWKRYGNQAFWKRRANFW
ncbi:hypothetical protein ECG_00934 [Echinococcus granulosus]|uniref:Neuropeptide n=1 Tax=Echinococcus granulosus TaxID=6210 RepID=A0A068WEX8_ECHGR|nr:hypothetical protein ECG_00934 [Echinococcus granulosus]CDS16177.1 hypothetical protein EgrG_000859300 [Echinococcus granulosus]